MKKILLHIKRKLKTFIDTVYKKQIDDMFLDCFPKITKEEAEELKKYIEKS